MRITILDAEWTCHSFTSVGLERAFKRTSPFHALYNCTKGLGVFANEAEANLGDTWKLARARQAALACIAIGQRSARSESAMHVSRCFFLITPRLDLYIDTYYG